MLVPVGFVWYWVEVSTFFCWRRHSVQFSFHRMEFLWFFHCRFPCDLKHANEPSEFAYSNSLFLFRRWRNIHFQTNRPWQRLISKAVVNRLIANVRFSNQLATAGFKWCGCVPSHSSDSMVIQLPRNSGRMCWITLHPDSCWCQLKDWMETTWRGHVTFHLKNKHCRIFNDISLRSKKKWWMCRPWRTSLSFSNIHRFSFHLQFLFILYPLLLCLFRRLLRRH